MKIALQLFSLKDELVTPDWQPKGTLLEVLGKISEMEFDGVEMALGSQGFSAEEIKGKLDELGLEVAGSHVPIESLRERFNEAIEFEKAIGNTFIVCPYADYKTVEDWKKIAKELGVINQKIKNEGLRFAFHNHAVEFTKVDEEKFVLDVIFDNVDYTEIDVYWAEYSGVDPVKYLKKYKGRTPLVHLKDLCAKTKESTIIGQGVVDIKGVIKQAKENGCEWLIIEQEHFTKSPLESVAEGLAYVQECLASLE